MAGKINVGYIETFPIGSGWQKIPLEAEIEITTDLLNCTDEELDAYMVKVRRLQYAFKKQVQNFFWESNKLAEKEAKKMPDNISDEIMKGIADILAAPTLEQLKAEFWLVSKTNLQYTEAYKKREKQLTDGTK